MYERQGVSNANQLLQHCNRISSKAYQSTRYHI